MPEYDWGTTIEKTTALFNESPTPLNEEELLVEWRKAPALFETVAADVCEDWQAGKILRPWPILLYRLRQRIAREEGRKVTVTTEVSVERQIHLAENWIRNAGLYEPSREALVDALFGEHGRLKAWKDDEALVERMVSFWEQEQPRGVRADEEKLARAQRNAAAYFALHGKRTDPGRFDPKG